MGVYNVHLLCTNKRNRGGNIKRSGEGLGKIRNNKKRKEDNGRLL
jgi:hypothetical protein